MSKITIIAQADTINTAGPWTYKVETSGRCGDITFAQVVNNVVSTTTSLNTITISAHSNPVVEIQGTFTQADCALDSVLATIAVSMTPTTGLINAISNSVNNPCFGSLLSIKALPVDSNLQQLIIAVPTGGNLPFAYKWTVTEDAVILVEEKNTIRIKRLSGLQAVIRLDITDNNLCVQTASAVLPSLQEAPVLQDFSATINCQTPIDDILIDIVQLAYDLDGSIDLTTITEITSPTKGSTAIDTATGIITYTPTAAQTGVDQWSVRIQDNEGNYSNTATFYITHTPCEDRPVATGDTDTVTCNGPTGTNFVDIDVLANDTDSDGFVDPDTLAVFTAPLHGTAVVQADKKIRYTPELNFEGTDIFRYCVFDNDVTKSIQTATLGLVTVTVDPCCNNHDAYIDMTCDDTGATVDFTATSRGNISAASSDTLEVDVGAGYGVGTTGTAAITCPGLTTDTYIDLAYTTAGGVFSTGAGGGATITFLGGGSFMVRIDFATSIATGFADAIRSYIETTCGKSGVLDITIAATPAFPNEFLVEHISTLIVSTQYIQFTYTTGASAIRCNTDADARVAADHVTIDAITTSQAYTGVEITKLQCHKHGTVLNTVKFRRTVVRSNGCANVVDEQEITLNAAELYKVCTNQRYTIASLIAPGGEGYVLPSTTTDYEGVSNDVGILQITDTTVNAGSIQGAPFTFDAAGVQAYEDWLQGWLDANGGGIANAYIANNTILIIQVEGTIHTFNSFDTNIGNTAFSAI